MRQTGYGDSAINLTLRAWVKTEEYWPVYFELLEQVKEVFAREQLSIPYPHRHLIIQQQKEL